ncbi:hypothetical protein Mapa_011879 [Marchantia paleacea]|nr:hypothetical protein Mapa_011879 [Marchantia paleacea]
MAADRRPTTHRSVDSNDILFTFEAELSVVEAGMEYNASTIWYKAKIGEDKVTGKERGAKSVRGRMRGPHWRSLTGIHPHPLIDPGPHGSTNL